ncbi:MAG: glycosyltransferase, partial [Planctomycetota bacterium]
RRLGAGLVLVEAALRDPSPLLDRALRRLGGWCWSRYVRRTARALVALDPVAEREAREAGFAAERVTIIPHGVNLNDFRPGLSSTIVGRHRIRGRILLHVGPLENGRGLETLLSAFARTVGQREDWSLVLAGDGAARPRLRALAERLGVAVRVHWPARPRDEELPGLFGASTLFAAPAIDDAVRGRQVSRALACGVPVLAGDVPRLRALVEHQHSGLLVPPDDLGGWSEAIRLAAGSPIARARWAKNARRVAEERLGWPAVARRFEELFRAVRAAGTGTAGGGAPAPDAASCAG